MNLSDCWEQVVAAADRNRVFAIGASGVEDPHVRRFTEWIEKGYHGSMAYLARNAGVRTQPSARFPWAKSVIAIAVPYAPERPAAAEMASSNFIARYAQGDDYHVVLDRILGEIESVIADRLPGALTRRYVDTGPLSDRSYGVEGGIGWIGKNGMLIHPELGSYFFIGTLLTSLDNDLEFDRVTDRCGSCTRCVDACPTDAILPGRTVDSNRCISHATIEQRGPLDPHIAGRLAGNIFGCDICQEVCPWNSAPAESHPDLLPRSAYQSMPVHQLLALDQTGFSSLFKQSAIKRAKRAGLIRNVLLAGFGDEVEIERELANENDPGIRDAMKRRNVLKP